MKVPKKINKKKINKINNCTAIAANLLNVVECSLFRLPRRGTALLDFKKKFDRLPS